MWRSVGTAGWIRDAGDFTLTAWERPNGWGWRCRNAYPAADHRHLNKDGMAATAPAAMRAANAAHAALLARIASR